MPAATFRPAAPEDWPAVQALLLQTCLPLDGAREHLEHFTLAQAGGRLVGCAGLEIYGQAALLRSVAVSEEARGQGLGCQLVQAALGLARARGVRQVVLLTETAADYFPRFGFRPVERAQAPAAVTGSLEFTTACPQSARTMLLDLEG